MNQKNSLLHPPKIVFVALLLSCPTFGQSVGQPITFHIEGTISSPWDSFPPGYLVPRKMVRFREDQPSGNSQTKAKDVDVITVPRTEITFHGALTTKTVSVNEKGAYQVDLPVGVYEMTARGPEIGGVAVTEYKRIFGVHSTATITLNGTLYFARTNCDAVVAGDTEAQRTEEWKNTCGGEDIFPYPSKDGAPLKLYIRYSEREVTHRGYTYRSERRNSQTYIPVFVAYNLFSLDAQEVMYDEKTSTIEASGSVVVTDATGTPHPANSISFIIRSGEAVQPPFNSSGFLQRPLGLAGHSTAGGAQVER